MSLHAQHVIHEALFRSIVNRERKRAERSHQPFVMLLLSTGADGGADRSSLWVSAMEAVTAAKRDTDVLGWFEWYSVIGVTVSDVRGAGLAACAALEARVRSELARRLDAATAASFSIRFHVHPEPTHMIDDVRAPVLHRTLEQEQERQMMYGALKRALDVVGSLALLIALSPLLVTIAVLVKSKSRGPILFRQARIGQRMKPFTMLKFRTMTPGADHTLHRDFVRSFINASGPVPAPGTNGVFKLTNDPRVTPVGRILRKTSLDELPQLWNVLRGDMSLVGPRPALQYELEEYKPWHYRRILEAKPGVTGLWQVAGRSRTTFDEMVRMDLRYVRRRSLWTDLRILLATPKAVMFGKGAC